MIPDNAHVETLGPILAMVAVAVLVLVVVLTR